MTNHIFVEMGTRFYVNVSEANSMVDIDFVEPTQLLGSQRMLTLNLDADEFKALYYKMHRAMTVHFFEKREKKVEQKCIITNDSQIKLYVTDSQTMSKFLHCMTKTDVGLSKNESEQTVSCSSELGGITDNTMTSENENGSSGTF